jgi:hypothetical protein
MFFYVFIWTSLSEFFFLYVHFVHFFAKFGIIGIFFPLCPFKYLKNFITISDIPVWNLDFLTWALDQQKKSKDINKIKILDIVLILVDNKFYF